MATQEQIEALKIDENVFGLGEETEQDFNASKVEPTTSWVGPIFTI